MWVTSFIIIVQLGVEAVICNFLAFSSCIWENVDIWSVWTIVEVVYYCEN